MMQFSKLSSFITVALLVAVLFAGIFTIPVSAQATPHFASLSPAFTQYQQDLAAGKVSKGLTGQAGPGLIPSPVDLSQLKGQTLRSALVGYPLKYDLRTQGKVTSVKDQGSCGSCWAFGAYASLESYLLTAKTSDFSENNMKNTHGFDPAPCAGGNQFFSTAYLARWSGPVNETDDPYSASSGSSPTNLSIQQHVQDVYFIPDRASSSDNNNIKMAISTYGAVYTQMYMSATSSYYNPSSYAYYGSNTGVNHGVAIVGWDDSYSRTKFVSGNQPPGDGAFIVKNSWGTSWGEKGYFYVSYYDPVIGKDNAVYTAQPTTNYNNIYQYDPLGDTGAFGLGSSTWGANIFTANASENLAAVSFYTLSLNAPYEVYIYTDPANGPINASGSAAYTSGSISLPGYHTIPLTSSVPLHAGQRFSVVVKFTSNDSTPVPTEDRIGGYSSNAVAYAGESYYHADNATWQTSSTWDDMTAFSPNSNICIKAFTSNSGTSVAQSTTLTASTTTTPAVNQNFTINGTLKAGTTPIAGATIQLQKNISGTWTNVTGKTNNTQSVGTYNITTSEPTAATYQYRTAYDGNATYQKNTSNVVNVTMRAGEWGTWASLSGQLTASPATVSWADGRIDVFARGTDNALWWRNTSNGGTSWSSWTSLGGQLAATTGPAASSQRAGQLDVFVIGSDQALWHRSYSNSAWSTWESLGGQLTASPAVVSWADGRIDVFGRGSDSALWHRSYTSGTWSTWESLGGQLAATTGPAVSSQATGKLDVFVIGSDNALWHRSYTSGTWSTWESLGGQLTASPAAVSWADGRIDVFGRGTDNALWWRNYSNSAWSAWTSLGGQLAATTGPAVSSQAAGQLDVFAIGSDQALWHRTYA
jgi:C1A family cysteine protease